MVTTASMNRTRDLVVVGASAGGITALPLLASAFPEDLPATVLIVQHLPTTSPRHLVDIVQRASRLPVRWAQDGEPLRKSEVVIAPPGTHLLVDKSSMVLNDGPRENHAKPSINRLFRSAAAQRGNSTIGVLLTGTLDDGVAGLDAIKWCGGTTIVQDPADAEFPDLPRNAVSALQIDRIEPLAAIGNVLAALAGTAVDDHAVPEELALHAQLDRVARADPQTLDGLGSRFPAMCPDCGGPLWRIRGAQDEIYRCFLGHAASCLSLVRDQAAESEDAMWNAVRVLEESAFTIASRAHDARARGDKEAAAYFDAQVLRLQEQASRQRELIMDVQKAYGAI